MDNAVLHTERGLAIDGWIDHGMGFIVDPADPRHAGDSATLVQDAYVVGTAKVCVGMRTFWAIVSGRTILDDGKVRVQLQQVEAPNAGPLGKRR